MAIGVVVFGIMFISIVRHRKAAGAQAARFHHSTFAEIAWTVIPIVILVSMAIPATTTLIEMEDTTDADLTVKVTGYQWKWKYEYIEDARLIRCTAIFSSHAHAVNRRFITKSRRKLRIICSKSMSRSYLPVNKKVRLPGNRQRRYPLLVGAGAGTVKKRCDSRASSMRSGRAVRSKPVFYPRAVRGVVRQGSRLYADRGQRQSPRTNTGHLVSERKKAQPEQAALELRSVDGEGFHARRVG